MSRGFASYEYFLNIDFSNFFNLIIKVLFGTRAFIEKYIFVDIVVNSNHVPINIVVHCIGERCGIINVLYFCYLDLTYLCYLLTKVIIVL